VSSILKSKILIVDDEKDILTQMRRALEESYEVLTAVSKGEALATFQREKPSVVTLDLSLDSQAPGDIGGLRLLEQMLAQEPLTRVIIVTDNDNDGDALQAVRLGAFDYYSKPIILDELKVMIKRALHIHQLQKQLQTACSVSECGFHGLVGVSKSMQHIYDCIEQVALSDISVLICGESGTGKELVAHAIHQRSLRRNNPFIVVNCGAIPETLLESELFGHEKGAFTGAYAQKKGKFELAHTGTLFLDEIGELVPSLQVKLLRFLQDRKIERVGSNQQIELDVRIIAATNRDLKKDMESRAFREDLYYRLKVVPLTIPPLRERKEDILPLAQYFLHKHCREHRKPLIPFSPDAERKLLAYWWPGNVRELENLINRAVVLASQSVINPNDLGFHADQPAQDVNLKYARKAMEADYVRRALLKNKGIISRAARDLGISRVNLYELIAKYMINLEEFKRLSPQRQSAKQQALEAKENH
jgi:two-component system NtrC family response regulator